MRKIKNKIKSKLVPLHLFFCFFWRGNGVHNSMKRDQNKDKSQQNKSTKAPQYAQTSLG